MYTERERDIMAGIDPRPKAAEAKVLICNHPGCATKVESYDGNADTHHLCDGSCSPTIGYCRDHLIFRKNGGVTWRWCFSCAQTLEVEEEWDEETHVLDLLQGVLDLRGGNLGTVLYWNLHAQIERMKARRGFDL